MPTLTWSVICAAFAVRESCTMSSGCAFAASALGTWLGLGLGLGFGFGFGFGFGLEGSGSGSGSGSG